MTFEFNRVATCGCEIRNDKDEIIAWSVDEKWAAIMVIALEKFTKEAEECLK
jgi:hypothetical protein